MAGHLATHTAFSDLSVQVLAPANIDAFVRRWLIAAHFEQCELLLEAGVGPNLFALYALVPMSATAFQDSPRNILTTSDNV
jgi:hypothetical protein